MNKMEILRQQYSNALGRFKEALAAPKNDLVRDSAIQRFEFTIDLAWKALKTYLEDRNGIICHSPKECFREAYRQKMIDYDEVWLKLVDMRNETAHTYNESTAERIYSELPGTIRKFEELLLALNR